MSKFKTININRDFYTMATVDNDSAEITMYGEIVSEQPTDWWGDPIEGQYIIGSEFLEDLEAIANCKDIIIRMNSCGGDASVSILIHNRLRELAANGASLTCIVDGISMSGGSLIMCACDTVKVNPSSLIMIHKAWSFIFGGYNADELRQLATKSDAYDKAQIAIYKRKCNLSDTVISHMMADTTYMTGQEALEKGFADELLENAEPLDIAASADGRSIFVRGREMHLAPGMFAPDNIPTVNSAAPYAVKTNINKMPKTAEGGNNMANTNQSPVAQPQQNVRPNSAENSAGNPQVSVATNDNIVAEAVAAEQKRIQEIDAIAGLFDSELVTQAKYGDTACTAQELAYRAAQRASENGNAFMANLAEDAKNSNAGAVGAVPAPEPTVDEELTEEQKMSNAKAEVYALLHKKED